MKNPITYWTESTTMLRKSVISTAHVTKQTRSSVLRSIMNAWRPNSWPATKRTAASIWKVLMKRTNYLNKNKNKIKRNRSLKNKMTKTIKKPNQTKKWTRKNSNYIWMNNKGSINWAPMSVSPSVALNTKIIKTFPQAPLWWCPRWTPGKTEWALSRSVSRNIVGTAISWSPLTRLFFR